MTKRELRRHFYRWVGVIAANTSDSPAVAATVRDMLDVMRADGVMPANAVRLGVIVAEEACRVAKIAQQHRATATAQ